jgi:hypothetical protein
LLGQLVAMLFCQLGSVNSLRNITNGLAASEGKLRHLGLPAAHKGSTLADQPVPPTTATVPYALSDQRPVKAFPAISDYSAHGFH